MFPLGEPRLTKRGFGCPLDNYTLAGKGGVALFDLCLVFGFQFSVFGKTQSQLNYGIADDFLLGLGTEN